MPNPVPSYISISTSTSQRNVFEKKSQHPLKQTKYIADEFSTHNETKFSQNQCTICKGEKLVQPLTRPAALTWDAIIRYELWK